RGTRHRLERPRRLVQLQPSRNSEHPRGAKTMQVETYEVNETLSDGTVEQMSDPESLALIEQLGLRGQETLLGKREAGDDVAVVRCPYRRMSAEEQNVFAVVCPQVTSLEEYASGPIPLRVLQVAAHA